MGLDQVDQSNQWHSDFHLGKISLALGTLFGLGLLVITKAKRLAAHQPSL